MQGREAENGKMEPKYVRSCQGLKRSVRPAFVNESNHSGKMYSHHHLVGVYLYVQYVIHVVVRLLKNSLIAVASLVLAYNTIPKEKHTVQAKARRTRK